MKKIKQVKRLARECYVDIAKFEALFAGPQAEIPWDLYHLADMIIPKLKEIKKIATEGINNHPYTE